MTSRTACAGIADRAARWLASRVDRDGRVVLVVDQRGQDAGGAELQCARSAVVLEALCAHGGHAAARQRLTEQLALALYAASEARFPDGWPSSPWLAAGTYALGCLAGIDCWDALRMQLGALPRPGSTLSREAAWHAGQVATVLGTQCPEWIWQLSAAELSAGHWAPWAARAAQARGEQTPWLAGRDALASFLANMDDSVSTAVIAASLEALALDSERPEHVTRAIERGRAYLCRAQLADDAGPAAGAFAVSTQDPSARADVTAHALLALLGTDRV